MLAQSIASTRRAITNVSGNPPESGSPTTDGAPFQPISDANRAPSGGATTDASLGFQPEDPHWEFVRTKPAATVAVAKALANVRQASTSDRHAHHVVAKARTHQP